MRCCLVLMFALACTGSTKESGDDSATEGSRGSGSDSPSTDDTADVDDGTMPPDPSPFTIDLESGASVRTLNFDLPSCQQYRGSRNFGAFWRDSARSHNYVLTMQVMGTFDGPGSYSSNDHRLNFKLLEEAPMTGAPTYWANTAEGDVAEIEVVHIDEEVAWGSATVSGLHIFEGAAVTMTPNTVDIWCPDVAL